MGSAETQEGGGCRTDPSPGPRSPGYSICEIGYLYLMVRIHKFEVPFSSQIEDLDSEIQLNQMFDRNGTSSKDFKPSR